LCWKGGRYGWPPPGGGKGGRGAVRSYSPGQKGGIGGIKKGEGRKGNPFAPSDRFKGDGGKTPRSGGGKGGMTCARKVWEIKRQTYSNILASA